MAKVNEYVQDRLASSLVGVPQADLSGANMADSVAKGADVLGQNSMQLAAQKQKAIDEQRAQLQNINDTISAYQNSTAIETEMWDIIDRNKQQYINDPKSAIDSIQKEGAELLLSKLSQFDNNPNVKEKMSGILTNSFRGKLNEVHSWALAQDTANSKNKIDNVFSQLNTQASKTNDISRLQELLTFAELNDDQSGMKFGDYVKLAYGAKGEEEINKAKTNIAKSYLIGMLDRKQANQVSATLDSGALDSLLSPEEKLKFKNMAHAVIKGEETEKRMNNMYSIFDIKENALIKSSSGEYTLSDAISDNEKIKELGGKPSDMLYTTGKGISGQKTADKKTREVKRQSAIKDITSNLAEISKGNKIDPEADLKDIIEFQNKVEGYAHAGLLTNDELKTYMTKVTGPKVKHIKKMGKNLFGMPQGDLRGKDEYSKAYLSIWNFADKAYAGQSNRDNAVNNMVVNYVKFADQLEAKQGKPVTHGQSQNILNKVIADQRRKSNPSLNNIPESGRIMMDKYGHKVKYYPDGRYEMLK